MSTESSSVTIPGPIGILSGGLGALWAAPLLLGLFLLSGITKLFLPFPLDTVVRILVISVGALIAYRALGGEVRAEEPIHLRLFMASIATVITYLLILAGIYATVLSGLLQYVFLLLIIPGLYVYTRLFVATTAVMVDGYGPFEALSESWELTDGAGFTIVGAVLLVFGGAFVVVYALFLQFQSIIIVNIGGILLADMPLTATQAFLYRTLSEPS